MAIHVEKIGKPAFDAGFADAVNDSGWGNAYVCPKAFRDYSRGYSSGMCRKLMLRDKPVTRRKRGI